MDATETVAAPRGVPVDEAERDALHIDLTGEDETEETEDVYPYNGLAVLIDAFAEAYNAHDLEGAIALLAADVELPGLGDDIDGFPAAVARCWDARPHAVLTRGHLGDGAGSSDGWSQQPVGVIWDIADDGSWTRVALLAFDDAADSEEEIGLVELVGDTTIVDEAVADPPERDLPEGARWTEWSEGADGG